ncbi:SRPBCC family protein [Terrabacter sp. NPDC080008]|uniref:SRPBCC family protein n=1 Tax=Terrabacter sp. NPDC080008 TaxID=3155176 RepID=UPI00344C1B03
MGRTRLKDASSGLLQALSQKVVNSVGQRVSGLTERLEGVASGSPSTKALVGSGTSVIKGENPIKGAVKGMASGIKDKVTDVIPGLGGKSGGGSKTPKATKATNFQEIIDVGVPLRVAYNQWTEFGSFPSFMKKVKTVDTPEDTKTNWKATVFWSSRTWESTIIKQVPDERIVWRSKGQKGHVDGTVTFHELSPTLTRIIVVLEYYPQGLFERTGNIWRAQGRRARLEIKHFQRHIMTRTILDPDSIEGWRGTIEDSEVVTTHEDALEQERQQREEEQGQQPEEGGEQVSEGDEGEHEEGEREEGEPEEGEAQEGEAQEGGPEEGEHESDESHGNEEEEGDEGERDEDDEYDDEYDEYEDDEGDEGDEGEGDEEGDEEEEYDDEYDDEYDEDEGDEGEDDEGEDDEEQEEPPARRAAQRGAAR